MNAAGSVRPSEVMYGGDSLPGGSAGRMARLIKFPESCFQADLEMYGDVTRLAWSVGVGRGMLGARNGRHWWQNFILSLASPSLHQAQEEWEEVVLRISARPRAAAPTEDEVRAGKFRFTVAALRSVRDTLRDDTLDQDAQAYAWMLWRVSALTGLRVVDLRRAVIRFRKGKGGTQLVYLENESGDVILSSSRLTPQAASACVKFGALRKQAVRGHSASGGERGEASLYAAAESAWERASAALPDERRPLLASARHLSIALWRNELDDMMLAALLNEEESDVALWGLEILPGSEIDRHRAPRPLRRAESKAHSRERKTGAAGR